MKTIKNFAKHCSQKFILAITIFIFLFSLPQLAAAHCDSYDGPVIKDALTALKENKVELVLKWVEPKYEQQIITSFKETKALENMGKTVKKMAETHFLETLVRLHREGEGEPFTGLKPAGSTTEIIKMADKSLAVKDVAGLTDALGAHIEKVIQEKYNKATELSKTKDESVEKGRAYVAAYVDYTHTLEAIHAVLEHGPQHGH